MNGILVALILLIQGVPNQQAGTVTGVLRDSQGMPMGGIRVTAVARPDVAEATPDGTAMAALAETDDQGRFRLEDIPPGRYVIAAGRLDLQTYYPGTQEITGATVVTIANGSAITGINFTLNDTSFGRESILRFLNSYSAMIPVHVAVENGGRLPVAANGQFTTIVLQSPGINPIRTPIDGTAITVPGPLAGDFRVTMDNLPDTYKVKSIAYGATNVTEGTFRLTPANFSSGVSFVQIVPQAPGAPPSPQSANLPNTAAALQSYLLNVASRGLIGVSTPATTAPSPQGAVNLSIQPGPPPAPPSTLSITLGLSVSPANGGVRVAGRSGHTSKYRVYISGHPGTLFSDGTFEFLGVAPGRHAITAVDSAGRARAAVVVVGDEDLENIELHETILLPHDADTPKDPLPIGSLTPGSTVPLARVSGMVVEEETKTPISEGELILRSATSSRTTAIGQDGRFETFPLLPGTYDVKVQVFGHSTSARTIVVGDKDLVLELTTRRLY